MRFLNTTTLQFELVPDSELHLEKNQYAILSHRWGADEDEVSYEDILSATDVSNKKGFDKIKGFCNLASSADCRYGWVDTCCINKGNSSELAEAINSMYLWYSCSQICFVYLEDVPRRNLMESEWFDRGWTLQELIAPRAASFFDQHWRPIGTKTQLVAELARKTRIPENVLNHTTKPSTLSVAQRMSWAAKRTTKRLEDRAYSLMGLFGVNMPMIYGERENAFLRLQQHIIQKSKDESIFAWAMEPPEDTVKRYSGLYAPSPSVYVDCQEVVQTQGSLGFSETNGELSIRVQMFRHSPGTYFASLHCSNRAYADNTVVILIAKTSNENEYVRVRDQANVSQGILPASDRKPLVERQICVPVDPTEDPQSTFFGFWLRTLQPPGHAESEIAILSNCKTPQADFICQHSSEQGNTGIVRIRPKNSSDPSTWSEIRWIKIGFTEDFTPIIWLANDSQSKRLQDPFERAVASQQSGAQSLQLEQIMRNDIPKLCTADRARQILYEWPEGRALVEVPGMEGLREFVIHKLGLQISVQLRPCRSPTMALSGSTTMMVWVVDMVETEKRIESHITSEHNIWEPIQDFIYCFLCPICAHAEGRCGVLSSAVCLPCLPCYVEKWTEELEEEIRRIYESEAQNRVVVLFSSLRD